MFSLESMFVDKIEYNEKINNHKIRIKWTCDELQDDTKENDSIKKRDCICGYIN